jgi:hypothetical protein
MEPTDQTVFDTRPPKASFDEILPDTFRKVLTVGHLDRDLDRIRSQVNAQARARGWQARGNSEETFNGRTFALDRRFETQAGDIEIRAVACGHDGYLLFQEQPLRPSRLPPCTAPALHDACAELESVTEGIVGLPASIERLSDGRLRTVKTLQMNVVIGRGSLTGNGYIAKGWHWDNQPDCSPFPPPEQCLQFGPQTGTTEIRLSRTGAAGRYEANITTTALDGRGTSVTTVTLTPRR